MNKRSIVSNHPYDRSQYIKVTLAKTFVKNVEY